MKHYPTNHTDIQWMLLNGILNDNRKRRHSLRDNTNKLYYNIINKGLVIGINMCRHKMVNFKIAI